MTVTARREWLSLDHGFARFLRMSITGALLAAILNLIVWYFAESQGAVLMSTPGGPSAGEAPLGYDLLFAASLVFAVGAALVYWILDRVTNAPLLWFFIASVIVSVFWYFRTEALTTVGAQDKLWSHILHVASTVGIWWAVLYVRGWFPIRDRR